MANSYELQKIHKAGRDHDTGRAIVEVCTDDTCPVNHEWGVYSRNEDGRAEWISDHSTVQLAKSAMTAYTGSTEYVQDLTQQLAASIMDMLTGQAEKLPEVKGLHEQGYPWGIDMSQVYVDVARMARDTATAWMAYEVEGVIYEVSEAIADECVKQRNPLTGQDVDRIVKRVAGLSILKALPHWIGMNGSYGCLPDSCEVYLTEAGAIESLTERLELSDEQAEDLRVNYTTNGTVEQGFQCASVTYCTCSSPWEHQDHSDAQGFKTEWPEFFAEVEA